MSRLGRLTGFLRLTNLRSLRKHPLRAALAILTVASGVAVIVAIAIELTSVQKALDDFGERLAGPAPVRVVGPTTRGGLTPEVVDTIADTPGVQQAVPVVRAVTQIDDRAGSTTVLALGIDCRAQELLGDFGCTTNPTDTAATPAVVSGTLAGNLAADPILRGNAGPLTLSGARVATQIDDFNDGQVVLLPLPVADQLFARDGRVDVVYVLPAPGTSVEALQESLSAAVGPAHAVLDAADPPAGFDATGILMPLLGVFALVGIGVGGLLVYQVVALSVAERRRDLAVSGALGASPRMVALGFLAEAVTIGIAGSVVGIGAGILLARPLVSSASGLTEQFLGVPVTPVVQPSIVVVGLLTGVLTAVGAAILPTRKATRVDLAGEISGRSTRAEDRPRSTWRRAAILIGIGGGAIVAARIGTIGGGLTGWQPTLTRLGLVVAIAALFALAGALAPNLIGLAARPLRLRTAGRHARNPRRTGGPPTLTVGVINLVGDARRTSALATAVAVPVATAGLLSGLLLAVEQGSVDVTRIAADDRAVATTTRFADYGPIEAKLSPATLAILSELPQVERVDRATEIEVGFTGGELVYIQAQENPRFPYAVLAGDPAGDVIARGDVIIGSMLARQRDLRPGDTLTLPTLQGLHDWTVGAVWAEPQSGGTTVLMTMSDAEEFFGRQPTGLIYATPTGGNTQATVEAIAAAQVDQPVRAVDPAGYGAAVADDTARFLRPFTALQAGLLSVAFISVVSTLLLVGIQRRREMATITAIGATPRRLLSLVTVEAIIAGTAGALLGAVVTLGVLDAIGQDAVIDIGIKPPFLYPAGTVAVYGALAVAMAAVAAQIPGWRATRIEPAQALRDQ